MLSQHVVILGGSSGIGLATAHQLLDHGFKVTIAARDKNKLAKAKDSLDGDVSAVAFDAADPDRVREVFSELGAFDHLVLALGSNKGMGPFSSVSLSDVRAGFEEKFFPHFACAQAALPHLNQNGSITFISATTAQAAMPQTAGIGAANAAIAALVPILAVELKPIRVNAVSPGVVDTHWWDFMPKAQRDEAFAGFAASTPVGRIGQPQDVAEAITFLVSNGYVSGHVLTCDGGMRLSA